MAPRHSFFELLRSRLPSAIVVLLGVLTLALSGCSAIRLAYGYADNYFVGIVQDYFDPTPDQLRAVRTNAQQLLAWHRQHELPLYVAMFEQAAQKTRDGISADEVSWGIAQLRERYAALALRIVEVNAPLLTELSPQNLTALERKFASENAKLERVYLDADLTRRDERRIDRIKNQFERWVGPLNAKQRSIIAAWVAAAPAASQNWYQARLNRQQRILTLFRGERNSAALTTQLTDLWLGRGPAAEQQKRDESRLAALILSLDQTLSEAQRARVVMRMQQYAEDFRSLRE